MGYAILNKPGGLPGHGCRSNNTENVCVLFHEALKVKLLRIHVQIVFIYLGRTQVKIIRTIQLTP